MQKHYLVYFKDGDAERCEEMMHPTFRDAVQHAADQEQFNDERATRCLSIGDEGAFWLAGFGLELDKERMRRDEENEHVRREFNTAVGL